ncbi:conserved phage C-terminal domain-containing protein [Lederbergia wuyishanensis]|uniref:Phage protein (TIGR02220 family) n=1 Tax=Lederbergia wuyishanensis TaxID=1347903 RepID=A0ABU0D0E7_9BACI|nr:conserved phage C-terminal domain-containing protein [Lederbergia wuyishanensis]MCJ8006505.1 conserved phage C-terminal domain-containing protein [Lederbergia wuyishanensis]MDQ0341881.1 putative phage protein (TIGR02220 family) [Lederbergia wuyishanensis]
MTTTETEIDINISFDSIIDYLIEKTISLYKPTTKKTQGHIRARRQEGFRIPDFQKVIDIKSAEWLQDDHMKKYLLSETLFEISLNGI